MHFKCVLLCVKKMTFSFVNEYLMGSMTTCMYAHTHIPTNNSLKTKCAKKVSNATELLNTMNNTQSQQVLNRKIFLKKIMLFVNIQIY